MKLFYEVVGGLVKHKEPLVILHGLFGSLGNWRTNSRALSESLKRKIYIADMRNHGKSPRSLVPSELLHYANDLQETFGSEAFHLLGHSMGGLVSMKLCLDKFPNVQSLIIEDVSPSWNKITAMTSLCLNLMQEVNESHMSRAEVRTLLLKNKLTIGIADFLMKNLKVRNSESSYEFDLPISILRKDIQIAREQVWKGSSNLKTLILKGSNSNYIDEEGLENLKKMFPNSELRTIDGGHWIHHDNPQKFLKVIKDYFEKLELK